MMSAFKPKASARQNANQGPPRWRWRSHFALTGVTQLFTMFFLSLFTYVASAGDECTYTPSPSTLQNKNGFSYRLQVESTRGHIHIDISSDTNGYGNLAELTINNQSVSLYTDSNLTDKIPTIYNTNNTSNIDVWFNIDSVKTTSTIKLEQRWKTPGSDLKTWYITWTLNVSCTTNSGGSGGGSGSNGTPEIVVEPDEHDFKSVEVGDKSSKVRFDISTEDDGEISNIEITDSSEFEIVTNYCDDGAVVTKERGCSIRVKFIPSRKGVRDFSMKVSSSAGTQYIELSGNGIAEADDDGGDCTGKDCSDNDDDEIILPPEPPEKVSLTIIAPNNGKVAGSGFDCGNGGNACKKEYDKGNAPSISLTATENDGYNFSGWSGACTNSTGNCIPTINGHISVTANFVAKPKLTVQINKSAHSDGTVTGSGINCPSNCEGNYGQGERITLIAKPEPWSSIDKWVGGDNCTNGATTCEVTMSSAKTVIVTFKNDPPNLELQPPPDDGDDNLERNFTVTWKADDKPLPVQLNQKIRMWEKKKGESSAVELTNCPSKNEASNDGGKDGSGTDAASTCTPSDSVEMKYNTEYVLEVTATDGGNAFSTKEWEFKTRRNKPPYPPITMSHCDKNAEEIEAKDWQNGITLTWDRPNAADYTEHKLYKGVNCDANPVNPDCENDPVTYLVYFEGSIIECGEGSTEYACIITPDKLAYGEEYDWQVFPTDEYNGEDSARNNAGDWCSFKTRDDQKPYPATNPVVNDCEDVICNGIEATEKVTLKATGNGDPDRDAVTYTISYGEYVPAGKAGEPDLKSCNVSVVSVNEEEDSLTCEIPAGELKAGKIYFWQVISSTADPDAKTSSERWQFTTSLPIPSAPQYVAPEDGKVYEKEETPQFAWTMDDATGIKFRFWHDGSELPLDVGTETSMDWFQQLQYGEEFTWWVEACNDDKVCTPGEKRTFRVENADPKLDFISVNGGEQDVLLRWEPNNAGPGTETPDSYNIYRVAGGNDFFDGEGRFIGGEPINGEEKVLQTDYTDNSLGEEDKGKRYCYFVNGYLGNTFLYSTNPANGKNCVDSFGSVEIELPSINVPEKTLKEIPITMPYPGDLVIKGANICIGYDNDVIEFEGVEESIFTDENDYFEIAPTPFNVSSMSEDNLHREPLLNAGVNQIIKFSPVSLFDPGKVEELVVKGDHPALLYMKFRTKQLVKDAEGNILKNSSILKFINFYTEGDATDTSSLSSEIANCSNINADFDGYGKSGVPIDFSDGSVEVDTRRGNRDGNRPQPAHIYVRDAYQPGDVNGNGVVEMMDFREAYQIQGSTYEQLDNVEKWKAANVVKPSDEQINEDDINAILNYAAYGETIARSADTGTRRAFRRKTRDGDDNPIVFSISDINAVSGDEVIATISATNLSVLSSMGLTIAYNTDVISEIVKVSKTGLTSKAFVSYNPYDNAGLGRISVYSGYKSPIEGSGEIAKMTLRLAEGGTLRSSALFIAQATLYDKYGRNFALSALERVIKTEKAVVTRTDVPEPPEPPEPNWLPAEEIGTVKPVLPINIAAGQIVDNQGNPMADMLITVGEYATITQANGEWVIYDLPAGEYLVTARQASDEGFVFMEKTCLVGNGEKCQLDFVVDTGDEASAEKYALYGTVVDRDGYPIKGATVKTGDKVTVTDKTGFFVFLDLVAGEYQVTARKGTENIGEGTCLVGGDSNCKLDFNTHFDQNPPEIESGEEAIYGLQISVIDELGNPIAGVLLQVGEQSVLTDEQGYGEIIELTEGQYTLTASKNGLRFKEYTVEVGNQQLWTQLIIEPLTDLKAKIAPVVWEKAEQGKQFSYRITVSNKGTETATEVAFEYQLPTGTELVDIRGVEAGACEPVTDDTILVCRLPDLVVGESLEVEVELDIVQPNSTLVNSVDLVSSEYPGVKMEVRTVVKPYLSVFCKGTPNPIHTKEGAILHYECDVELNDNAPTAVATEVVLTVQLPRGVNLNSLATDYGLCDITQYPTVTCELVDLTIENPDDTSHITLYMDVELIDPGLLVLINQASVKAYGYATHTSRERTKVFIPPEYKVDMVLVIDVTRSMQEEMNGVKKALTQFAKEFDASQFPLTALVVFRDDVTLKVLTTDVNLLEAEIGKMKAEEGGACPEASFEALNVAIDHVKDGGTIFLVTDASPYPDSDVAGAIQRLRDKGIRLHPMITGDCSNEEDWNRLNE
jgi:uncharacterized repeat protein (TIGR01451 family)